jgi:hypothetical protein
LDELDDDALLTEEAAELLDPPRKAEEEDEPTKPGGAGATAGAAGATAGAAGAGPEFPWTDEELLEALDPTDAVLDFGQT